MSVSLIALLSAVVLLLRNWILGIYTTDPEVIRVGAYVMLWIVPFKRHVHAGGGHRRYHAGNRIFHHAYRHHLRMCLCIPGSLDFPSGQPVAHCGNAGPGITLSVGFCAPVCFSLPISGAPGCESELPSTEWIQNSIIDKSAKWKSFPFHFALFFCLYARLLANQAAVSRKISSRLISFSTSWRQSG